MDANDEYGANLPLKDYGKRKANDAVDSVQHRQPAAKRMKHESSTADKLNSTSSSENSTKSVPHSEESKNQKKKKKKKTNAQSAPGATPTNSTNSSEQFDYGQVDFKKFKGGSQQAKRNPNEVQTKFHGKVIWSQDFL